MPTDREREADIDETVFADMQALLRFGHGALRDTRFLLLDVADVAAAGRWLGEVGVTGARAQRPAPSSALQIAFTVAGLRELALPETLIAQFSDELLGGMSGEPSRSRRLGDVGDSDPDRWTWGSPAEPPVQVLLLLYARPGEIDAWHDDVANASFHKAFRVRCVLPTAPLERHEPFGFTDGISQPAIDWERHQSTDRHSRDRYSNLLAPGEVVLGYPNEYGRFTRRPLLDPQTDTDARSLPPAIEAPALGDLGRNGTYLVLRQLEQDVPGFWRFVDEASRADEAPGAAANGAAGGGDGTVGEGPEGSDPGRRIARREHLAAAMVGRRRDGMPLAHRSELTIPGVAPADAANRFTYDDDPDGHHCPLGAHVRRANPRTGDLPPGITGTVSRLVRMLGFGRARTDSDMIASSRFHRLLRRGRAYGPPLASEDALRSPDEQARGLQFICLSASILRQFEFVQNAWIVGDAFAGTREQDDPLLGNRQPRLDGSPGNTFRRADARGPAHRTLDVPRFAVVRGGAYFFMPGIAALRYIGATARRAGPADASGMAKRPDVAQAGGVSERTA